jgi:hypothetical protein
LIIYNKEHRDRENVGEKDVHSWNNREIRGDFGIVAMVTNVGSFVAPPTHRWKRSGMLQSSLDQKTYNIIALVGDDRCMRV